jgi:hypothetical protein
MKKYYLLTPGPTPVPHRVAAKSAEPILHHRTKEFQNILINKCGVTKTKLGYNKKTNFIRIIEYNGYKNIFKIVKFIYSNSPIWLERKRKIAFDFLLTKFPKDKFLNNLSFSEVAKTFNCWI